MTGVAESCKTPEEKCSAMLRGRGGVLRLARAKPSRRPPARPHALAEVTPSTAEAGAAFRAKKKPGTPFGIERSSRAIRLPWADPSDLHRPGVPQLPLLRQGTSFGQERPDEPPLLLESSAGPLARLGSGPVVPYTSPPCRSHEREEAPAVPGLWPPPAAAKPHYMHLGFWHSVWIRRQTHQRWISTPHAPCSGGWPSGPFCLPPGSSSLSGRWLCRAKGLLAGSRLN